MSVHESRLVGRRRRRRLRAEVKLGDLEALQGVVKFPVRIKLRHVFVEHPRPGPRSSRQRVGRTRGARRVVGAGLAGCGGRDLARKASAVTSSFSATRFTRRTTGRPCRSSTLRRVGHGQGVAAREEGAPTSTCAWATRRPASTCPVPSSAAHRAESRSTGSSCHRRDPPTLPGSRTPSCSHLRLATAAGCAAARHPRAVVARLHRMRGCRHRSRLGCDATIVEVLPRPLARVFPTSVGDVIANCPASTASTCGWVPASCPDDLDADCIVVGVGSRSTDGAGSGDAGQRCSVTRPVSRLAATTRRRRGRLRSLAQRVVRR